MIDLRFTIPEILSLIGLIQCVYILVYVLFRAGNLRRAILPLFYFLVLGLAFFLDFASRSLGKSIGFFAFAQWAAWFSGPPLSLLLIVQVARISERPPLRQFWVLLLIPLAAFLSAVLAKHGSNCTLPDCPTLDDWLIITGLAAGLISLTALWGKRRLLQGLSAEPAGRARYWLILTLIFINLFFLATMLFSLTPLLIPAQTQLIRTVLGLGLVYLAGSSLFRIYPQTIDIVPRRPRDDINDKEKEIAHRIEGLLSLEKIYQEPAYDRSHLARELGVPEAPLSRIINVYFKKSFPQLLNEHRIKDARQLLHETDLAIKVVAEQVGFNSLASFNRVFREQTGTTPSAFRKQTPSA